MNLHTPFTVRLPEHTEHYLLTDDGLAPNNPHLPVVIYRHCLQSASAETFARIKALFETNKWTGVWDGGIYDYPHYHSTAHEVIAVYQGRATVRFGGAGGPTVELKPGDSVIIPAGVAHQCLSADADFRCAGAYPEGQALDLVKDFAAEREKALQEIPKVKMPAADPLYGPSGILIEAWTN